MRVGCCDYVGRTGVVHDPLLGRIYRTRVWAVIEKPEMDRLSGPGQLCNLYEVVTIAHEETDRLVNDDQADDDASKRRSRLPRNEPADHGESEEKRDS